MIIKTILAPTIMSIIILGIVAETIIAMLGFIVASAPAVVRKVAEATRGAWKRMFE